MKTLIILFATFCNLSVLVAQSRIIPYFGKMETTAICGDKDCRPTNGTKKAYVASKIFYNNDYNSFLGKKFKGSPFPLMSCLSYNITDSDIDVYNERNGTGKVDINQKNEFDANITANLMNLIREYIVVNKNAEASLLVDLKKEVAKETSNTIDFEFKIIQLKNTGEIDKEVNKCFESMKKGESLMVGASVISLSGAWTSNTLKKVLDNFELSAAYRDNISGEAQVKYQQSKSTLLSGKVKKFSFIIGDSFLIKK